ncbi:hypothetical protein M947_05280 [Sulfurimonas hongkongensis]|uniref:Uncharacterized protein n=1 Tax=Sulfurimonas hongkongensis TaxID=1172190 RepID=T0L1S9_9BACT|nr:hypothetical protein M947_05280 [Sulfurimonas hongkongensis]
MLNPTIVVIEVRRTGLTLREEFFSNSSIFFDFLSILNIIRVSFITIPTNPTNPNKDEKDISIPISLCPKRTPNTESGITLRAKKDNQIEENNHVRIIKIPNRAKSKEIKISFMI